MRRDLRRAAVVMAVAAGIISLLFTRPVYRLAGAGTVLWIYDLTVVVAASVGLALSFLLWRSFSRGEVLKRIWGSLTLGLLLWTIGEAIWSYYQLLAGHQLPYPSLADFVWIAGYVPVAFGLLLRCHSLRVIPSKGWRLTLFLVFVTLATLAVAVVAVPIIGNSGSGNLLEKMVNVVYPIGDLAITIGALSIALMLIGGSLSVPWGLIAAGCFCVAVADLLYGFGVWQGTYQVGPPEGVNLMTFVVNLLYAASYVIADIGLYMQARLQRVI
ncbi:MAG: hypothetical protein AB1449_09610 [Chloroflexota bacterium]